MPLLLATIQYYLLPHHSSTRIDEAKGWTVLCLVFHTFDTRLYAAVAASPNLPSIYNFHIDLRVLSI